MTRDDMLTKLRDDRDAAAARGGLMEALILNDRIRDLKSGATSPAVEALTWKRLSGPVSRSLTEEHRFGAENLRTASPKDRSR